MTLLVRDEIDIVAANLEHHLAQGVDHVVVTDNLSVDGTADLLCSYERQGAVTVLRETSDTYAQSVWVTRMARLAATDLGADWVINNDADEFWWPRHGTLASTLADVGSGHSVVVAHRHNFPPVQGPGDFLQRMTFREVLSTNAFGEPLPPKVCHRATAGVHVHQGNHHVDGPSGVLDDGRIEILHFPLRSYQQFENKIRLGGAAYRRNADLPVTLGATWRWLHEQYEQGLLADYYDGQELTQDDAERGVADGTLVVDKRLVESMGV